MDMTPRRIALTGGIATGKSTVAKLFEALGAVLIDADQVAREVVQPGSSCWDALHNLLGPDYFCTDGCLDRRKVRDRIIHDDILRSGVNAILHPAIMREM
jgi:dephospho-CoA kinase